MLHFRSVDFYQHSVPTGVQADGDDGVFIRPRNIGVDQFFFIQPEAATLLAG